MEGHQHLNPLSLRFDREFIERGQLAAGRSLLELSPNIRRANFERISAHDLLVLFGRYDHIFFASSISALLQERDQTLTFRLSRRMTSAGAQLTRNGGALAPATKYEIAVAVSLLSLSFRRLERQVIVDGVVCKNRLEALQRLFEHELIHLVEHMEWGVSSCKQPQFRRLAGAIFGHKGEMTHQLTTPKELAGAVFGVQRGTRVEFSFAGRPLRGVVARITKRATVLVRDESGRPFSDGNKYTKYYIPVSQLRVL